MYMLRNARHHGIYASTITFNRLDLSCLEDAVSQMLQMQ